MTEEDLPTVFSKNKQVYLKKALSPDICKLAAQYGIFDSVVNYDEDLLMVKGSHSKYGDSLMEALLLHLQPTIENATGLQLYPTYSFYRTYKAGNELKKHTDRPACEISVSVCLGYNYSTPSYFWNLWVGKSSYSMEVGDIAIYKGLELEHWREPFEGDENSWQVQAFLHYVDVNGSYAFLKNDTRPAIGLPFNSRNEDLDHLAVQIMRKEKSPSFVHLIRG